MTQNKLKQNKSMTAEGFWGGPLNRELLRLCVVATNYFNWRFSSVAHHPTVSEIVKSGSPAEKPNLSTLSDSAVLDALKHMYVLNHPFKVALIVIVKVLSQTYF